MCKKHSVSYLFVFVISCALFTLAIPNMVVSQEKSTPKQFTITAFKTNLINKELSLQLMGDSLPAFTVSERFSPFRVILDIANTTFSNNITKDGSTIPKNDFATLKIADITVDETSITRFEFKLADTHTYKIKREGNDIDILFTPTGEEGNDNNVKITDIQVSTNPDTTVISLHANQPFTDYTVDTLAASGTIPPRMYIDIKNVDISELIEKTTIGTDSVSEVRVAARDNGGRIVFNSGSNNMFQYTVNSTPKGLDIIINEGDVKQQLTSPTDDTLKQLIASSELIADADTVNPNGSTSQDLDLPQFEKLNDAFLGYNKDKISVDFYKIDLHNVFRLFREVSGLNILVDEAVSGTLTIAMSDVPWDFALDVILNLKGLAKEEKFNTIVIYPKDKGFVWPSQTSNNLTVEADTEIITQEELIIEESANQPPEILKAKEILAIAKKEEAKGNFEQAVDNYLEAFELWPSNEKIADRLTTLYLVNLKMNARALHFAKKSLEIDANNTGAALYAAISSANMGRNTDAAEFFRQSISGAPPAREALMSFAAFSENNGNNDAALKLLKKLHANYGESVESMVAIARILDKQSKYKEANTQYAAILTSGFQLRPALKKYIDERLEIINN